MRPFPIILCVVAIVSLTSPALASPFLEVPGNISLPVVGGTDTATVNLTDAVAGLSGYNLTLEMSPSGTAEIVSVEFPPWANLPVNGTLPAERTWIQAIDLEMGAEPGGSPFGLAAITIRAIADGETMLTVVPAIIDDDQGGRYTLDPIQIPVRVGTEPTEVITSEVSTKTMQGSSSSSSSADGPPPGTLIAPDTTLTPAVHQLPETTACITTTNTSPLPSPSVEIPSDEPVKISAEATPGFDCTIICLAGMAFCAFALLKRKKGE